MERLQKVIARAGIASRRKAEELIRQGRVTVNGTVVTKLGTQVDPARDHVKVEGKRIRPEPLESWAVHKPRNVVSTASDPEGRPTVTELVRSSRRLYPAGRLDFDSEGLVIVTNDGDLARLVTRAGGHEKRYRVKVRGVPDEGQLRKLAAGVKSAGERFARCWIRMLRSELNSWLEVRLREGRNRQVRRMFESIGHPVMRLRRIAIGPLQLGDLKPGAARRLTAREIEQLKSPRPSR